MGRRRLLLTVVFSLLLLALLPLSYALDVWFGFGWLYLPVFGIVLAGLVLLWPFRLLFLVLLVALGASGYFYGHEEAVLTVLLFLVPYAVACVYIAYRVAGRLAPEEWEESEYPEEPGPGYTGEPGYGDYGLWDAGEPRPQWNPYADDTPLLLRREPAEEDSPGKEDLEEKARETLRRLHRQLLDQHGGNTTDKEQQ